MAITDVFEQQLFEIVSDYTCAKSTSRQADCSDFLTEQEVRALQTRCLASIVRVASKSSIYYETANRIISSNEDPWTQLAGLVGVVESLHSDLCKGYLKTLEELIHSDVFSDFLEMAEHLTDTGYKDAGAVIAGSTLEAHLRKLAEKHNVASVVGDKPVKAETLNVEITKKGGYLTLDQKNVTAWLDLRNDAAHGRYDKYDKSQVKLLISSIRDFVTRNPA